MQQSLTAYGSTASPVFLVVAVRLLWDMRTEHHPSPAPYSEQRSGERRLVKRPAYAAWKPMCGPCTLACFSVMASSRYSRSISGVSEGRSVGRPDDHHALQLLQPVDLDLEGVHHGLGDGRLA